MASDYEHISTFKSLCKTKHFLESKKKGTKGSNLFGLELRKKKKRLLAYVVIIFFSPCIHCYFACLLILFLQLDYVFLRRQEKVSQNSLNFRTSCIILWKNIVKLETILISIYYIKKKNLSIDDIHFSHQHGQCFCAHFTDEEIEVKRS